MTNRDQLGPRCGNNPNVRLTDGDRQAIDDFKAFLTDRAALRQRVSDAIEKDLNAHKGRLDMGLLGILPRLTDAVVKVLPAPADRAAVYREVADRLAADAEQGDKEGFTRIYRRSAAKQVRDWADELTRTAGRIAAEQTPASDQARAAVGVAAMNHPATVAYRRRDERELRCLAHAPAANLVGVDWFPLTELEVEGDASTCTHPGCTTNVLADEVAP